MNKQFKKVKSWASRSPNVEILFISHSEAIHNSESVVQEVSHFVNQSLDSEKMIQAVDKSLYREQVS